MTESLAISQNLPLPDEVEQALVAGDLSGLSAEYRVVLYHHMCKTQGLNPYTRPFQMMKGQDGKLWYYAGKNCADQIRNIHNVTLTIPHKEIVEGCYIVTARASLPNGRQDEDIGGVPIANLKGEALANAMMKAITKAKRRVTLSIVGLGMLDESEIESIPGAHVYQEPVGILPQRIAPSVTELKETRTERMPPMEHDQEQVNALLHAIDVMLQPAFRWDIHEEREKGAALIRQIFGVGYKMLKSLPVEELQAGYDELQSVLEPPSEVKGIDDDDVPNYPPGSPQVESPGAEAIDRGDEPTSSPTVDVEAQEPPVDHPPEVDVSDASTSGTAGEDITQASKNDWWKLSKRALSAGLSDATWETLRQGSYSAALDRVEAIEDEKAGPQRDLV